MTETLQRILKTLAWAVLASCLVGSALHNDAMASDALAPKYFWFAGGAGLLAALAVLKLWQGAALKLPRGALALAWGIFLAVQGLAYLSSPLKLNAYEAWQAWLLVALLFIGAYDLLVEEAAWLKLLRLLSAVALAAGLWSAAQALGLDHTPMGVACREAFGPRIAGCLGNPNFAGGYFLLLLPVLAWSALKDPHKGARVLGGMAFALALAGLWLSASKAAVLGLGAELAVSGHLFFWSQASKEQKTRVLKRLGGLILAAVVLALLVLPTSSRQRLVDGWKPGAESVQFRRLTWQGSLKAALERPLLGWGPGNFAAVYPGHRPVEATAGLMQRSYEVSHAENWVVQTLVESGVLGLAALLFLLLSLTWPLRLAAKAWAAAPLEGGLALALCASLLGSLAGNLASLDLYLPSSLLPFVLLCALAAHVAALPLFSLSLNPETYARVLVSLGLAIFASVPAVQAQLRWSAGRDLAAAKAFSGAARFDEAIPLYQRALLLHPRNLEARYFLASSLQDRAASGDLVEAAKEYARLQEYAPDYVLVHAKLARLNTALGDADTAALEWRRQLAIDPYLLQAIRELAGLEAGRGRLLEAAQVLRDGVQRYPDDGDMQRNLQTVEAALRRKGKR